MASFVEINDQNNVVEGIVIANDDIDNLPYPESEPVGQAFIANFLGLSGTWLQTSRSGAFRGLYASPGMNYNPATDEFYAPVIEPAP